MLVLAGTLNYIDRATLSVANPLIRNELGLSVADMGLLLSAFLWAYAFFQLPGGALVDTVGPRRLLTAGLAVWSVAQAAAGLVGSFGQFCVARVFLGLGEAPMFSSAVRVVRDWFSPRQRGLAMGICNTTSSLGPCYRAANPHFPDAGVWLALDVRPDGRRRRRDRSRLVRGLPRCPRHATDDGGDRIFDRRRERLPPASKSPSRNGGDCSASARPGA